MENLIGQYLGNYRLNSLIGRGGFGEVYLAEHIHLGTLVAIKVLSVQLVNQEVERFRQEARTIAHLVHPNIVRVFDFDVHLGVPFLVMDYAPHGTLATLHPKGTIVRPTKVVSYVKQVASALQYAHDQKIIHRDVKPYNMFVGSNNEILLGDFGIATIANDSSDSRNSVSMAGTALYMAPEQIEGRPQLASDQYALGITVYQWLCGELPFIQKGNFIDIMFQHLQVQPAPLREKVPYISPNVENVVLKALSKDPKQRFGSVMDFASALEQATRSGTIYIPTAPTKSIVLPPDRPVSVSDEITLRTGNDESILVPLELKVEASEHAITLEAPPTNPVAEASPVASTLLFTQTAPSQRDLRDFFIIYARADRTWARWVAWELEDAKYSVILPPWYLHSESDFDMEMEKAAAKAKRIVFVLSLDSLTILNAQPAHITTLKREAAHYLNKLLPICVRECGNEYRPLLDSLHHIDIVGEDELTARTILLAGIQDEGVRQTIRPSFPGNKIRRSVEVEPEFPQGPQTMDQAPFTKATNSGYQTSSTPPPSDQRIEIFFSYSHRDKKLRDELDKYMSHLKRHPLIKAWHDGEIGAGSAWAQEIDIHLNKAKIILLLVSQDFIASNYCYDIEMQKAIQRHEAGEARVIPIILHPAFWENTPIGKLQALPTGARPITDWSKRHHAFMDVVRGIQREVEKMVGKI